MHLKTAASFGMPSMRNCQNNCSKLLVLLTNLPCCHQATRLRPPNQSSSLQLFFLPFWTNFCPLRLHFEVMCLRQFLNLHIRIQTTPMWFIKSAFQARSAWKLLSMNARELNLDVTFCDFSCRMAKRWEMTNTLGAIAVLIGLVLGQFRSLWLKGAKWKRGFIPTARKMIGGELTEMSNGCSLWPGFISFM